MRLKTDEISEENEIGEVNKCEKMTKKKTETSQVKAYSTFARGKTVKATWHCLQKGKIYDIVRSMSILKDQKLWPQC